MTPLDPTHATTIADAIIPVLEDDGGFTVEEMIPGLIQAVVNLARTTTNPELYLDCAVDLLADGGVRE